MTDSSQTANCDTVDSASGSTSITWEPSVEHMLARWCDEAKCFEWMHTEAFTYYDKWARRLVITSNSLIALSGISNVVAGDVVINDFFKLSWLFGGLSVIISITNMLQEKLAYAAKSIEHDHHATLWNLISKKIEEQLLIPPTSRKDCGTFLKYLKQDLGQVTMTGNSLIPADIREACNEKFGKIQDFELPEICGKMEHTKIYVKPNQ
jgi:hypothetical protein